MGQVPVDGVAVNAALTVVNGPLTVLVAEVVVLGANHAANVHADLIEVRRTCVPEDRIDGMDNVLADRMENPKRTAET